MLNILLTGSGGFIGKNLKNYFEDKYNLLCPRSYELDLTDACAVKKYFIDHKIDFVVHCGSIGGVRNVADKNSTIVDNLAMVRNILEAKEENVRVILFGSGAMYGKSRPLHKVSESEIGKFLPEDLYGQSKVVIANEIKDRNDVLCLNIFACYGYGEKESRFPSYAVNQVLRGQDIEINQNVVFDYLFVEDMQKIVHWFIEHEPQDNIINITPDKSVSLQRIAEIVNGFGERKVNVVLKTEEVGNEYTGDNSLLKKNYPNVNFTPIELGLKKLYEYNTSNMKEMV